MNKIDKYLSIVVLSILSIGFTTDIKAQQDPQFTHYMYNTMSVNPGYTGSLGNGVILGLGRTQWVGFDGAPDSETLSYHTPLKRNKKVGLGFNLVNDKLGPASEIFFDANASYSIDTSEDTKLAFGLKLGGRLLNIDWSIGKIESRDKYNKNDNAFSDNINNRFLPTVGAGLYYYSDKGYLGFSIPNFFPKEHYDPNSKDIKSVGVERMHFFLIGGYVYDVTEDIKFKPATLFKGVSGAPLVLDVSANFLFNDKFTAGLAWRWNDSISALLGLQVNRKFYIGYGYDLTTTAYSVSNSGTHEIMLRYEFLTRRLALRSPRFF